MKKKILIIIVIFPLIKISALDLDSLIDKWNNNEISSTLFLSSLDLKEENLSPGNSEDYFYEKSVIDLYRGIILLYDEDNEESINYFESAMKNSTKALEIAEKSDYYRVLSEAGSYLMLQKGISYIIKHSKKVNENAKKALKLNPDNVRASIIVAGGLLNAPAIFGGNKKKGITTLTQALKTDGISNEDRFNILMMLAESTGDEKYISEAQKIYPKNYKVLAFTVR